jgi:hypothetical protein
VQDGLAVWEIRYPVRADHAGGEVIGKIAQGVQHDRVHRVLPLRNGHSPIIDYIAEPLHADCHVRVRLEEENPVLEQFDDRTRRTGAAFDAVSLPADRVNS